MTTGRFQQTGHAMVRYLIPATIVLAAVLAGCANPMGSSTRSGGTTDLVGDVAPTPITITFVLDTDAGEGMTLSTSHSAPAPIAATAGVPLRLDQGIGFTATGPGPGGGALTYHASGWSTEPYSSQYERIMNPSSSEPDDGWYLPGFEATFNENTTLYIRWLPEFDNIAAQVTFVEPGTGTRTVDGPVMHLRDVLPFERTAYFQDALSAPWTVSSNQRVWEWKSETVSYSRNANSPPAGTPAVWQFVFNNGGEYLATFAANGSGPVAGLRPVSITYTPRQVYTITFDANGGTMSSGVVTRDAFADIPIANNVGWWGMSSETQLPEPTRGNLTFANDWFFDPDYSGDDWFTNATADTTLYAQWQTGITFDPNGGSLAGLSQHVQTTILTNVTADGVAMVIEAPGISTARAQHDVFGGWFTEQGDAPEFFVSNKVSTGANSSDSFTIDSVTGPLTLYAGWIPQYEIGEVLPGNQGIIFHILGGSEPQRTQPQSNELVEASITNESTNWRFLAVAPVEEPEDTVQNPNPNPGWLSSGTDWQTVFTTDPGSGNAAHGKFDLLKTLDVLGGGRPSTAEIIAWAGSGHGSETVARQARESDIGGLKPTTITDLNAVWYLPSASELIEIANARNSAGTSVWEIAGMRFGSGATRQYWTSTTYNGGYGHGDMNGNAFFVHVSDSASVTPQAGTRSRSNGGTNSPRVRPVRRF
ncbi:repeat domain (List_Bact_rpt) [Alkalispirochaeta americana]|uniref:Repeat domain (List_Bact_rpt) n=1 Tax=Alkalispirochaeta americana TaxID=159291 RepID=A0A1N6Q7Q0_9SPIO|nr:InlB B-repeat-containing protein [Alkalispirochaeta americana]SIQ12476.1 repeat domain (List_Bact_rpt) [Alkalispirochaeta americana]